MADSLLARDRAVLVPAKLLFNGAFSLSRPLSGLPQANSKLGSSDG